MKYKLLITGANGFLGWNLVNFAKLEWDVYGLSHNVQNPQPGLSSLQCDITDQTSLQRAFNKVNPDAVIHLAAASSPNDCEQHPEQTRRVNVDASAALAILCEKAQIPLVFTSSSQVYGGCEAPYTESSPTTPINDYGKQKLEAEQLIREHYPNATICRVPLMFGPAPPSTTSSLQLVLNALHNHRELNLFVDEWRSSLGALSASKGLCHMLEHPGELFILAGDETLSRYDFGCRVAQFFKVDSSLLIPIHQSDITMSARRPADLTMCNAKAKEAGFTPHDIHEELSYSAIMDKRLKGL